MKKCINKIIRIIKSSIFSSLFAASVLCAASCEIGLGESVDIEAPVVEVTSPEPTSAVAREFKVTGSVSDNIGVTSLNVSIAETGQKFVWNGKWNEEVNGSLVEYKNATFKGDALSFTWEIGLSVEGAKSGQTYTLCTSASDEAHNDGKKSKDERSITVDVTEPAVSIISPTLFTSLSSTNIAEYNAYTLQNGSILKKLINKSFTISGTQKEDTRLSKLYVMLDTSDEADVPSYEDVSDISSLPHIYLKELEGSRSWSCDVSENDIPASYRTGKHLVRLITESHDVAGNIERKVKGWFTYWNESDIPWVSATFGDDAFIAPNENANAPKQSLVYPGCSLQGQAYDDDGLASIEIKVYVSETAEDAPVEDAAHLNSLVSKTIDLSGKEYPTFYEWSLNAISQKKNFLVIVKCVDKNGIPCTEEIRRYLAISNVSPPNIIINEISQPLGSTAGKLIISGTVKDDGPLESNALTMVRIANNKESTIKSYYSKNYTGWTTETDGNGIYNLPLTQQGTGPVGGYYIYQFSREFDLFSDFSIGNGQNIKSHSFMFMAIDGKPGDDRSETIQSYSVQGDSQAPALSITQVVVKHKDTRKANETYNLSGQPTLKAFERDDDTGEITDKVYYTGTWSDNSTSYWAKDAQGNFRINPIVFKVNGTEKSVTLNDGGTWTSEEIDPPDTTTVALTASIKDWGGNESEAKANYNVSSSNPRLERISSVEQNGSYKAGSTIHIVLEYNKRVTFTPAGAGAVLTLNNGATASYDTTSNTNGTSKHQYLYTVSSDSSTAEETPKLNVSSISKNSSEWTDPDGMKVLNPETLPSINLENTREIKIDKTSPTVKSISVSSPAGAYKADKKFLFTVEFDKDIKFTNENKSWSDTKLNLSIANEKENVTTKSATAYSMPSSTAIMYEYTVAAGDNASSLTASFDLNGSTITDKAGNALTPPATQTISGITIDTEAPGAPTVSAFANEPKVNNNPSGIVYSDSGSSFTVSGEPGASLYYSVDNGTTWLTYPSNPPVTLNDNGTYNVKAYQVDAAGNKSPVSPLKTVTLDKGKFLTSVTSSKPDGIYNEGTSEAPTEILITLNFRKKIKIIGSKLELNVTGNATRYAIPVAEPSSTAADSVTYKYTVQPGDSCAELAIADNGFTFTSITDENGIDISSYVPLPGAGNRLQDNRSIKILTGAPSVSTAVISSNGSKLTLTFDSDISKGNGNIKLQVTSGYKAPAVIEKKDWTYGTTGTIANCYYLGTNGSDGTGKSDLTEKYVLKYTYDSNNTELVDALKTAKADIVEIPVDSTAVTVGDKKLEVDISDTYKLPVKGAAYTVTIPAGLVQNELGTKNAAATKSVTAPGVEKPVIRINKIKETIDGTTVTQPLTATVKIDCQTPDVTIKYKNTSNTSDKKEVTRDQLKEDDTPVALANDSASDITEAPADSSITDTYSTAFDVGSEDDITSGYKVLIAARAEKGSVKSETSYEYAQRTVVIFDDTASSAGLDYRWIRGGDWTNGGVSTPDFPFSWKSDEYDKVRAMTKTTRKDENNNDITYWYWVSWNINTTAYVGFLAGDMPSNASTKGPKNWCWGSCAFVGLKEYYPAYPGESLWFSTTTSTFSKIDGVTRGNYGYQDKHKESRP